MSNEEINIASTIDDETNPIASGQVGEEVEVQAETPELEQELFDYTEIADKVIKLQVDGEEVVVPVKEALAGYQRQADYTRKTQELSEQRKQVQYASALQEALQSDHGMNGRAPSRLRLREPPSQRRGQDQQQKRGQRG